MGRLIPVVIVLALTPFLRRAAPTVYTLNVGLLVDVPDLPNTSLLSVDPRLTAPQAAEYLVDDFSTFVRGSEFQQMVAARTHITEGRSARLEVLAARLGAAAGMAEDALAELVLLAERARGTDWVESCRRANVAGAIAVTRRGPAAAPTASEIDAFLAGLSAGGGGDQGR